jgi:two-component system, NtrC family, sensor kinase
MKMENKRKITDKKTKKIDWRQMLFDSLSFPTLIMDKDKNIIAVNKSFIEKFDNKKDLIGKKCYEYFFNSNYMCENKTCPLPRLFSDKDEQSMTIEYISKGVPKWEDRVYTPTLDENGEIAYIRVSIRDITQVKILEKELKEIKNLMEKIIQSSVVGIVAANLKGELLLMNRASENLFGYSFEEFKKRFTVKDFYHPGVAKEIMKKLRSEDYGGKGKLTNTKVDIVNSKGEIIPGEIVASIIYENDEEIATMGIYTDLRDKIAVGKKLKKTQKQLAQSEKMASIGQLAAGVAHEINNPLTGILFNANMLLENKDKNTPITEELENIIEDVNRCKDIVKDLLVYSRQSNPSKKYIHLNTIVEQSLSLIHDQKLFGNIIITKILSDEMMLIKADENQLYQVIINLVINAADAIKGDGTLTLSTYCEIEAQKAYVEISDTGCGISKKDLPKIFDPFFTTKELGKGTGLGLSTVYGIIKENEGHISVKETNTKGTTFLIEFPLHSDV